MKAKLKQSYFLDITTACGGREFLKTEYRDVPSHEEESARNNPDLEILEDEPVTDPADSEPEDAHEEESAPDETVRVLTPTELQRTKRGRK